MLESLEKLLKAKFVVHLHHTNISGYIVELYLERMMIGTDCADTLEEALAGASQNAKENMLKYRGDK